MEPSATSRTGCSGSRMLLCSVNTSAMRSADSSAITSMTSTIATIMRLLRIWKL